MELKSAINQDKVNGNPRPLHPNVEQCLNDLLELGNEALENEQSEDDTYYVKVKLLET